VCTARAQTISGFVEDATSGERLIGANVFDPELKIGTTTNAYGFFSLTFKNLGQDSVALVVSYIGYETWRRHMPQAGDRHLTIRLHPTAILADSITVEAEAFSDIAEQTEMSVLQIPVRALKVMPAFLGEVDVIKSLQLLPGVQSGNEGTSGLYIRGGGPDQNLILLDGAPVYNASHLFGFFSVFNSDALKNIRLTKGGFPARYGGRLSSVVEVNMKEGNNQETHARASIGLVAARFMLEGPIQKGKSSFILTGRRTYIDLLVKPLLPENESAGYFFHDLNGKFNHIFSPKHRLYLSLYTGLDRFHAESKSAFSTDSGGLSWGNVTSTARWNWLHNPKLFSNTLVMYSRFRFEIEARNEERSPDSSQEDIFLLKHFSGIEDYRARIDFDYLPSPAHAVKLGAEGSYRVFNPGAIQFKEENRTSSFDELIVPNKRQTAREWAVYAEDDLRFSDWLKLNVGLHSTLFAVNGRRYLSVQPRLSSRVLIGAWAVKSSYAEMRQNIHLLTNTSIGLPTDLWLPATDRVRPQFSRQIAAGVARSFRGGGLDLSVEGYYKTMANLIEYKEGASFIGLDADWQDKIAVGSGRAYGVEFFLHKKRGRATGWLGYTLSWSHRQFDDLNFGKRFSYRYDRRHDIGVVFNYHLSEGVDFSATWVYGTGNAISLPTATFLTTDPVLDRVPRRFRTFREASYYEQRNGVRMGAYHRLDLALKFYTRRGIDERFWTIGLYNAYHRQNPFYYFRDEDEVGQPVIKQVSLFPLIPAISYTRSF